MMKKTYIIPAIEVIEFAAENLIAASVRTGKGTVNAADALSNKHQPASNSWNSQNWGEDGE